MKLTVVQQNIEVYINDFPEENDLKNPIKPGSLAIVWMPSESGYVYDARVGNGFYIIYIRLDFIFDQQWCKAYSFECNEKELKSEIPWRVLKSIGIELEGK